MFSLTPKVSLRSRRAELCCLRLWTPELVHLRGWVSSEPPSSAGLRGPHLPVAAPLNRGAVFSLPLRAREVPQSRLSHHHTPSHVHPSLRGAVRAIAVPHPHGLPCARLRLSSPVLPTGAAAVLTDPVTSLPCSEPSKPRAPTMACRALYAPAPAGVCVPRLPPSKVRPGPSAAVARLRSSGACRGRCPRYACCREVSRWSSRPPPSEGLSSNAVSSRSPSSTTLADTSPPYLISSRRFP